MDDVEELGRAGHADRAAADHGFPKAHGLAADAEEIGAVGGEGRGLPAVEGGERAARRVVVDEEGAAAEARGLRLDQPEHGLHRDHRVDRVAASPQHLEARFGRQRVGSGHHLTPRRLHRCQSQNEDGHEPELSHRSPPYGLSAPYRRAALVAILAGAAVRL